MIDIVARLRSEWTYDTEALMEEAANEIERLREVNKLMQFKHKDKDVLTAYEEEER